MIARRTMLGTMAGALFVAPLAVGAQGRVYRVGLVSIGTDPARPVTWQPFREAMQELGYVEGRNFETRQAFGNGDAERTRDLIADLVRSNVDVIVTTGIRETRWTRQLTSAIPIVMTLVPDPVAQGFVVSLARPGGNVTGLTTMTLSHYPVRSPQDFDAAFAAMARDDMSVLVAYPDGLINLQAKVIAEFTARQRLPAISGWSEFAQAGNLMSYGPIHRDFNRQLASFVDRLLKGAKPADLPVERPTRFELVINLKAAVQLGLSVPQALLMRADEVIQ